MQVAEPVMAENFHGPRPLPFEKPAAWASGRADPGSATNGRPMFENAHFHERLAFSSLFGMRGTRRYLVAPADLDEDDISLHRHRRCREHGAPA